MLSVRHVEAQGHYILYLRFRQKDSPSSINKRLPFLQMWHGKNCLTVHKKVAVGGSEVKNTPECTGSS